MRESRPDKCATHAVAVDDTTYAQWQDMTDILSSLLKVPAALIMRAGDETIEVFVTSDSEGNPYKPGDSEHLWGSGLYCERVIRTQKPLLIPDATADPEWAENPDIKRDMISYLGYPINFPDGAYFGTLCILDNKANPYSEDAHKIMKKFQETIQGNLALLQINHELGEENRTLSDLCNRIRSLKGIHPICCHCHKIRNEKGQWENVADYISSKSEAVFSHSICDRCVEEHHPESYERTGS